VATRRSCTLSVRRSPRPSLRTSPSTRTPRRPSRSARSSSRTTARSSLPTRVAASPRSSVRPVPLTFQHAQGSLADSIMVHRRKGCPLALPEVVPLNGNLVVLPPFLGTAPVCGRWNSGFLFQRHSFSCCVGGPRERRERARASRARASVESRTRGQAGREVRARGSRGAATTLLRSPCRSPSLGFQLFLDVDRGPCKPRRSSAAERGRNLLLLVRLFERGGVGQISR